MMVNKFTEIDRYVNDKKLMRCKRVAHIVNCSLHTILPERKHTKKKRNPHARNRVKETMEGEGSYDELFSAIFSRTSSMCMTWSKVGPVRQ